MVERSKALCFFYNTRTTTGMQSYTRSGTTEQELSLLGLRRGFMQALKENLEVHEKQENTQGPRLGFTVSHLRKIVVVPATFLGLIRAQAANCFKNTESIDVA